MYTKAKLYQIKIFLMTFKTMCTLFVAIRLELLNGFPKNSVMAKQIKKLDDLLFSIKAALEEMAKHPDDYNIPK